MSDLLTVTPVADVPPRWSLRTSNSDNLTVDQNASRVGQRSLRDLEASVY